MRLVIVLGLGLTFTSCSGPDQEATEKPDHAVTLPAPAMPKMETVSQLDTAPEPTPTPTRPAHNYDEQNGLFYSYIAAISEDDRKAGKAAGDVVTYAYLGMRRSKHVLVSVRPDGSVISEAYCSDPCRVISYPNGRQVAFNESSIIGSAFADAIAGRLAIAEYARPQKPTPQQAPAVPDNETTTRPSWSEQEAILISKWRAADQSCRFGTSAAEQEDGCANRDGVYSASLRQAGICTTRKTRFGTELKMHRCDEASVLSSNGNDQSEG